MKKFIVVFSLIVGIVGALLLFVNSNYFFNHYIAPVIHQYGFDYKKVNGSLSHGFKLEQLQFQNETVAKEVELRFNPLGLLKKEIYLSKLSLIGVDKQNLKKIIDRFKTPKSENKNSFDFNLYLKNINLSFKPFQIENINIWKNHLKIESLKLTKKKFTVGKTDYLFYTDIGEIEFNGFYKNKILTIDTFNANKFKLNQFIKLVKKFQTAFQTDSKQNQKQSSIEKYFLYIPKKVKIKKLSIMLKPFVFDILKSKKLLMRARNVELDIYKAQVEKGEIKIDFSTNLAHLFAYVTYNNEILHLHNINLTIKKGALLASLLESTKSSDTSFSKDDLLLFLPIKEFLVDNFVCSVNKFIYKKDYYQGKVNLQYLKYNLNTKKIATKNFMVDINSSLLKLKTKGFIAQRRVSLQKVYIKSFHIEKLFSSTKQKEKKNNRLKTFLPIDTIFIKDGYALFNNLKFGEYKIYQGKIKVKKLLALISLKDINATSLQVALKSNWLNAYLKGKVKKRYFYANGQCQVLQNLLDRFKIPLIAKNLKPLKIYNAKFGFNDLQLEATINTIKEPFSFSKKFTNLNSKNFLYYNYHTNKVLWSIKGDIKYDGFGLLHIANKLNYLNNLQYKGSIFLQKPFFKNQLIQNFLKDLSIQYSGNSQGIDAKLNTQYLKGKFKSFNYKKAILSIENKAPFPLKLLIPRIASKEKISRLQINTTLNFTHLFPIEGDFFTKSTIFSTKGKFIYKKNLQLNGKAFLTKKIKNLKKFPIIYKLAIEEEKLLLDAKSFRSNIKLSYSFPTNNIKASLQAPSLKAQAQGKLKNLQFTLSCNSLKTFFKESNKFYFIKLKKPIDGAFSLKGVLKDNSLHLKCNAKKITIDENKIENINITSKINKNFLTISNYSLKIKGYKFFAHKPSVIYFKPQKIKLFWINDTLSVSGSYKLKPLYAHLKVNAKNFTLENSDAKINLALNNNVVIKQDKIKIAGKIVVKSGTIRKNLKRLQSEDEDIIIIQRQKAKKDTNFAKNFALNLKILSQGGILYSQAQSHFILKPNLTIVKNFGSLSKINGFIALDKKSYYILKGKRLSLVKGKILFKGKSTTPYLDITLLYNGKEYKVYVMILGTPNRPILNFRSSPPLTKEQILAYLLFDDSTAVGTHSQESMVNLIGGTLAKSFLGSIGLKIDHILLRENGFTIGKNIGKHIIIYYNQEGEKSSIKTRVDISKSVHTEIKVGQDSQSADIILSKEY